MSSHATIEMKETLSSMVLVCSNNRGHIGRLAVAWQAPQISSSGSLCLYFELHQKREIDRSCEAYIHGRA